MANTLSLGSGNWGAKDSLLLGYYENGKKFFPETFDVTRATGGTRVNKAGLIETPTEIGSELITNGDFSNGSTDWTLGSGWTIANGKLIANNVVGYALQVGVFESGVSKTYRINLSISDYVSGYFTILTSGGTSQSQQFNANGNYTIDFNSNSPSGTTLHFTYFGSFTGSIDNVSVKEINQKNLARIDYSDDAKGALLTEPQSTNLIPCLLYTSPSPRD